MKLARSLGLSLVAVVAACGQESTPAPQPLTLALERPFEACQERYETCRVSQNPDPAACQASMRKCLQSVASWMQESRALIEKCRGEAAQCRVAHPTEAFSCNDQFESCVAPAFRPSASDEDAGAADEDAGAAKPTEGAAGSTSLPPVAGASGSAGSSAPGLPPQLPGSITAADACRSELLECLTPGADLVACATRARACLRTGLLPGL